MVRQVTRPVSRLFGDLLFRRMYRWQVGRFVRQLFPTSELFLLDGACHYVQLDEPAEVGRLILGIQPG